MSESEKIKKLYEKKFKKYGEDPKSLFWQSKGAAHQRFRQFWAEIDFTDKSVLDVGCGFGELGHFLTRRYENVNYFGIDNVSDFIKTAQNRFPELAFEVRDYLTEPINKKFDVVVASGILNSNVADNMAYRKKAIKTMFGLTKKVLAFNMLGAHPQPKNDEKSNIWYADSFEVLNYCATLTRRIIFRANYHPKDFTIFMYPVHGTKKFK